MRIHGGKDSSTTGWNVTSDLSSQRPSATAAPAWVRRRTAVPRPPGTRPPGVGR